MIMAAVHSRFKCYINNIQEFMRVSAYVIDPLKAIRLRMRASRICAFLCHYQHYERWYGMSNN